VSCLDFDWKADKIAHAEFCFTAMLNKCIKSVVDCENALVVRRRKMFGKQSKCRMQLCRFLKTLAALISGHRKLHIYLRTGKPLDIDFLFKRFDVV